MNIAFCILSGGRSKRFNQDKAKAILGEKRLIDYPIELITQYTKTIYVSCQYDQTKDRVSDGNKNFTVVKIRDEKPFRGPLCGIYYVTKKIDYDYYLFFGLDMPFITNTMVDMLINQAKNSAYISVFGFKSKPIPLPILLSKQSIIDFFKEKKCDNRGIKELLLNKKVNILKWKNSTNLININTQEHLIKAEQLLRLGIIS